MAKRNAEVVLQYSTLYPFRLRGKILMCVYCCEEIEDPEEFRHHVDEMHKCVDIETAFFHLKQLYYLKVDCVNLKCRLCREPFITVSEIAQHLMDRHDKIKDMDLNYEVGLQPYRLIKDNLFCLICNIKQPNLNSLARHMSTHYINYACNACDKSYMSKEGLKAHVRFNHSAKYICRKCKKVFPTSEEKKEHLKTSTHCWGIMCSHDGCTERFASWDSKQKHLVSNHNGQPLSYRCPDCEIAFESRSQFYQHYNTLHSELAVMCSYCGKKFKSKREHDIHLVIHTGEKPFKCTACSKAYSCKKSLRDHMWSHSETKRYPCKICNAAFCKKVSFDSHMKKCHL